MRTDQYQRIYEKYLSGKASPEEERMLLEYRSEEFKPYAESEEESTPAEKEIRRRVFQQIRGTIEKKRSRVVRIRVLYIAAATLTMVFLSAGLLYFNFTSQSPREHARPLLSVSKTLSVKPGGNAAILTLSNGSVIQIDKAENGLLASEGKTLVKKTADGHLVYEAGGTENDGAALVLNTISIPRAGQYSLRLPDGTLVWLNSETVLVFPSAFTSKERKVQLKGEGYFEVAKDASRPFIVETEEASVEVLGTHFNVRAYPTDNAVFATLLEGRVKVDNSRESRLLSPGEQGIASSSDSRISVSAVRVNDAVAWKNGLFVFRDNTVREIMEQVARWYNVDVEYRGDVARKTFGGVYSKNKDLDQLLTSMELTKLVHFKREGRRIIVMP
ncbi:FecR family protein [Arcticibacter sp. MXS-1]|uniref:FecR family protein n=1 Tax=Arcticibacter sp. MXS-1 TaxID=3341726 RepID=UPI0035A863A7